MFVLDMAVPICCLLARRTPHSLGTWDTCGLQPTLHFGIRGGIRFRKGMLKWTKLLLVVTDFLTVTSRNQEYLRHHMYKETVRKPT